MAVVIAGDLRIAPPMAARQQFGATVLGRECIDSDDRRHADRRPWPRNPLELIVIVDWLRLLARTDTDRLARRQQITRLPQAVEQRNHARVLRDALADRTPRTPRVDTLRAAAPAIVGAAVAPEVRLQHFTP